VVGRAPTGTGGGVQVGVRLDRGSWETPFNGVLDEPAVYGTALSAARIAAHYDAGT
jgi:hypothetical protein